MLANDATLPPADEVIRSLSLIFLETTKGGVCALMRSESGLFHFYRSTKIALQPHTDTLATTSSYGGSFLYSKHRLRLCRS